MDFCKFYKAKSSDLGSVELYVIDENGEEKYYFPETVICNCQVTCELLFKGVAPIVSKFITELLIIIFKCHHLIAIECAKRLKKCEEIYLSATLINQCIIKKSKVNTTYMSKNHNK